MPRYSLIHKGERWERTCPCGTPLSIDLNKVYEVNNGITLCRPCHQKTIRKEMNYFEKYSQIVNAQMYQNS